ncbi:MAG TPA: hypothetical protein VFH92_01765, partial [Phenylobacterium sp.]|nr:hypothetical protein [Phenylobacterium sp.]
FWDTLKAGYQDAVETRNTDVRTEALRQAAVERHAAIEKALGRQVPRSDFISGIEADNNDFAFKVEPVAPGVGDRIRQSFGLAPPPKKPLTQDEYEAQLATLRAQNPQAFTGIETWDQVRQRVSEHLSQVRQHAEDTSQYHPVAGFVGSMAGGMTDPLNFLSVMGGGGARTVAGRILETAAQNVASEATQIPLRMRDAQTAGGPAVTAAEIPGDLFSAGVGGLVFGGAFEGAHFGLKHLPALRAAVADVPAARASVDVLERGLRDDAAIGPQPGPDYEAAAESLATGGPPPAVEPDRNLADLFSPDAGGGPDVALYKGRPIYAQSFDPANLTTDPARFQYKAGGDAEGVTARLRGVEQWDPLAAGRVLVWEDRQGGQFIADGHQRFGLVRRLNDERGFEHSLDGYLFREQDGWTASDLRVLGALKNIREGSGSPMDAAKVFREAPQALQDRSLPVTGDFIGQAQGLANLEEAAFRAAVNRVIDERYAAEIGTGAAQRPDLHMDMVRLIKEADPANVDEARSLVFEALQDDWIKTQGSEQDLFGYDPSVSAMIGRAKVAAAVKRQLGRDARLFGQLVKNADAIEAGGNALARDANQARLAVDRAALEVSAKLALRHGPIGEAMARAAKAVSAGESAGNAAKGVLKALRAALEAGERLDDLRTAALAPEAPGAAREALANRFDDPAGEGAKAQARPAPENAGVELGPEAGRAAVEAEIDRVLEAAAGPGHAPQKAVLGEASSWLVDAAREAGLTIDGFNHVLDGSAVRHVMNRHGEPGAETARGGVPVKAEDFRALPEVLGQPDLVAFGSKGKRGEDQIFYVKRQPDGSTLVIEEVRRGKQALAVQSMRRVPGAIDATSLAKAVDLNARNDAGALKIVRPPQDASAVADAAPPGLFDDIHDDAAKVEKAHQALIQCVPGGTE